MGARAVRGSARRDGPGRAGERGAAALTLGFESELWAAADLLRSRMDPGEYKHVVLGLIFLRVVGGESPPPGVRVPASARWSALIAHDDLPTALDAAMQGLEDHNPTLAGVLPRHHARLPLDASTLRALVELFSRIDASGASDALGRTYEYFLSRFASAEGRHGGEFYTPACLVDLLVALIRPFRGRVYDPCCGSGGMFVQSLRFAAAHGGAGAVSVFGQESNATTWRIAKMNLALRGIDAELATPADTLLDDRHPGLRADFVLANPPFNISRWGGERLAGDDRWAFGDPPAGNANFAWIQHIVHHLAPGGVAGVVLANGSMSSRQSGEGEIRRGLVEAGLVDAMIALPPQLFYATQIPVCLWVLARDRPRAGEVLFVDARGLGRLETRVHRVLDPGEIDRIARVYRAWRDGQGYADAPGFCRSVAHAEIDARAFTLTPGLYVGAPPNATELPNEDEIARLSAIVLEQAAEGHRLDARIAALLAGLVR